MELVCWPVWYHIWNTHVPEYAGRKQCNYTAVARVWGGTQAQTRGIRWPHQTCTSCTTPNELGAAEHNPNTKSTSLTTGEAALFPWLLSNASLWLGKEMSQLGLVKPSPPGEPGPSPEQEQDLLETTGTTTPAPTPQVFSLSWIWHTLGTDRRKYPNYTRLASPLWPRSPRCGEGKQRRVQPDCSAEAERSRRGACWSQPGAEGAGYTRHGFRSASCSCCPRWLRAPPRAKRLPGRPCLLARCEWSRQRRQPVGTAQRPSGGRNPTLARHRNAQTMQVAPQRKPWVLLLETQGETPRLQKQSAGASRRAALNLWGYQKNPLLDHNITMLNKCDPSLSTLRSSVTPR